jgi:hypothetical protein
MTRLRSPGTNRLGLGQMSLHHLGHRTTPELEPEAPCQHRPQGHQGIMVCPPFDFMMRDPFYWFTSELTLVQGQGETHLRNDRGGISPLISCDYCIVQIFLILYLSLTIQGG